LTPITTLAIVAASSRPAPMRDPAADSRFSPNPEAQPGDTRIFHQWKEWFSRMQRAGCAFAAPQRNRGNI
jgi:hypothetical protein